MIDWPNWRAERCSGQLTRHFPHHQEPEQQNQRGMRRRRRWIREQAQTSWARGRTPVSALCRRAVSSPSVLLGLARCHACLVLQSCYNPTKWSGVTYAGEAVRGPHRSRRDAFLARACAGELLRSARALMTAANSWSSHCLPCRVALALPWPMCTLACWPTTPLLLSCKDFIT